MIENSKYGRAVHREQRIAESAAASRGTEWTHEGRAKAISE
ncbi:MAG: hypothetical protein AB9907_12160 [Flexilinea sp.]